MKSLKQYFSVSFRKDSEKWQVVSEKEWKVTGKFPWSEHHRIFGSPPLGEVSVPKGRFALFEAGAEFAKSSEQDLGKVKNFVQRAEGIFSRRPQEEFG
jgi:hypothetical protein